ncbi:hypothetical protein TNCV_1565671 [Trichonephila clavipes]|nr:hypothetical protein TNCV_1565671 [Trichonephila clavipes]
MSLFVELESAKNAVNEGNSNYRNVWVRLGSTELMAGKVMFLRSNQGDGVDDTWDDVQSTKVQDVTGNRDYTRMWVRLGSTDLMAGKVMFLRYNQGDRLRTVMNP